MAPNLRLEGALSASRAAEEWRQRVGPSGKVHRTNEPVKPITSVEQIVRLCGPNMEHVYKVQKITGATARSSYCCFRSETLLATGGYGSTINTWHTETGALQSTTQPGIKRPSSCFNAAGDIIVAWGGTGQSQSTLDVTEIISQKSYKLVNAHTSGIKCCAISPDRQSIITGDDSGAVVLWDISSLFSSSSGYTYHQLGHHTEKVKCCCFSQDGLMAATGSNDKSAVIWDVSKRCAVVVLSSTSAVLSCTFSAAAEQLACGSKDGTVCIYDVQLAIKHAAEAPEAADAAQHQQHSSTRDDPHQAASSLPLTNALNSRPSSPRTAAPASPRYTHRAPSPLSIPASSLPKHQPHSPASPRHQPNRPSSPFKQASSAPAAAAPSPQQLTPAALAAAAMAGAPHITRTPSHLSGLLSHAHSHLGSTSCHSRAHTLHPDSHLHATLLPDMHKGSKVRCVSFSPDSKQLLSGDSTGALVIWDLSTPTPCASACIQEHSKPIRCCMFIPYGDADQLISCAEDGIVMVQACAVIRQEQGIRFPAKLGCSAGCEASHMRFGIGHAATDRILDCRWLLGDVALCVQQSGQVHCVDVEADSVQGHPDALDPLSCCSLAQGDHRLLAAGRRDGTVLVAPCGPDIKPLCSTKLDCYISAVAMNADARCVAVCGYERKGQSGVIYIWQYEMELAAATNTPFRSGSPAPDLQLPMSMLASSGSNEQPGSPGSPRAASDSPLLRIMGPCNILPTCASWCALHSELLVCGSASGQLLLYNHSSGALSKHRVAASSCRISCCQYAPGGQHLVYGCDDGCLVLWDPAGQLQLHSCRLHRAALRCCSFSEDGGLLVAGDASGLVSVWDAKQGSLLQLFRCHSTAVQCVRFNAPATQVLSCGTDHQLVATDVNGELMDMYAEGFKSLFKAAGRDADGAVKLLQALHWHMEQGIVQEPSLLQQLLYSAARDGNAALLRKLLQLFTKAKWQPLFGSLEAPAPKSPAHRSHTSKVEALRQSSIALGTQTSLPLGHHILTMPRHTGDQLSPAVSPHPQQQQQQQQQHDSDVAHSSPLPLLLMPAAGKASLHRRNHSDSVLLNQSSDAGLSTMPSNLSALQEDGSAAEQQQVTGSNPSTPAQEGGSIHSVPSTLQRRRHTLDHASSMSPNSSGKELLPPDSTKKASSAGAGSRKPLEGAILSRNNTAPTRTQPLTNLMEAAVRSQHADCVKCVADALLSHAFSRASVLMHMYGALRALLGDPRHKKTCRHLLKNLQLLDNGEVEVEGVLVMASQLLYKCSGQGTAEGLWRGARPGEAMLLALEIIIRSANWSDSITASVLRPLVRLVPALARCWHWLLTSTSAKAQVSVSATARLLPITFASQIRERSLLRVMVQADLPLDAYGSDVVRAIINVKWTSYARTFLLLQVIQYFTYFVLFLMYQGFAVHNNDPNWSTSEMASHTTGQAALVLELLLMVMMFGNVLDEVRQMKTYKRSYFTSVWNYLDLSSYTLMAVVFVLHVTRANNQLFRILVALQALLLCMRSLYFLLAVEHLGAMVRMVMQVIRDMRWFFVLLLLIIIGFAIAFNILLTSNSVAEKDASNTFGTFDSTLVQLFTMMMGGVDYDTFNDVRTQPDVVVARLALVLLVVYSVLAIIVLLNMLIAIVSETYADVKQSESLQMLRNKAAVVDEIESILPEACRRELNSRLLQPYVHVLVPQQAASGIHGGQSQRHAQKDASYKLKKLKGLVKQGLATQQASDTRVKALEAAVTGLQQAVSGQQAQQQTTAAQQLAALQGQVDAVMGEVGQLRELMSAMLALQQQQQQLGGLSQQHSEAL